MGPIGGEGAGIFEIPERYPIIFRRGHIRAEQQVLAENHADVKVRPPSIPICHTTAGYAVRFSEQRPSFYILNVGETHYPYALPDEPPEEWPRISGVHGVFKHLDDHVVGGKLKKTKEKFFDDSKLRKLKKRQIDAVRYLDRVVEELFDTVPKNTYITITADHGELFGEDGYFGHGPIQHDKVFEVPFLEGKLR